MQSVLAPRHRQDPSLPTRPRWLAARRAVATIAAWALAALAVAFAGPRVVSWCTRQPVNTSIGPLSRRTGTLTSSMRWGARSMP